MQAPRAPKVRSSRGLLSGCGSGLVSPLALGLGESQGYAVEYLLQHMLPLLKPLLDELCLRDASRRSSLLALWLLERSGFPPELLQPLKELAEDPNSTLPAAPRAGAARASDGQAAEQEAPEKAAVEASPERRQASLAEPSEEAPETPREREDDARISMASSKRVSIWASSANSDKSNTDSEKDEQEEDSNPPSPMAQTGRNSVHGPGADTAFFDRGRSSVLAADSAAKRQKRRMSMRGSSTSTIHELNLTGLNIEQPSSSDGKAASGRRFTVNMSKVGMVLPPFHEVLDLLRKVPAFKSLPDEELAKVAGIAKCNKYDSEENLIACGCVTDEIHIIMDGIGKVSIPYQISTFKHGDFFGEEALRLAAATSQVQVSAAGGPLTTLSINGSAFKALDIKKSTMAMNAASGLRKDRLQGGNQGETGNLQTARETGICPDSGLPVILDYAPSKADREVITMSIKNNRMLGGVLELTEQQCNLIADSVFLVRITAGNTLMKQGDKGTALYIIQEGIMDCEIGGGEAVKLRTGDSFGELALLYDTPRSATITAAKDCDLWVLTRPDYKLITSLAYKARIEEYIQMLCGIPAISKMVQRSHMDMLADVIEKITFYDGEEICCEGEDEGLLFIIYEGECQVLKDGVPQRQITKGEWVGEEQVIDGSAAVYTVRPTVNNVTALVLDTNSLVTVVKVQSEMSTSQKWTETAEGARVLAKQRPSLATENAHLDHALKNQFADDFLKQKMCKQVNKSRNGGMNSIDEDGPSVTLKNVVRLGVLGEGTYGSVVLLEDTVNQAKYALKALSKAQIVEENMGDMVANERNILMMMESEFIVKCYETYQDEDNLFFILEPVLGGELFDTFTDNDFWGKIPEARFYMACVTLGLQHMHAKRVVYRDLKLENCILDGEGYLKLTDMGIAKVVMGKTYTVCGTADYFAPETLRQCGHDRAVDWWAAGVLLFIMVTGKSPFDAPQVTQIYKNIMKGFSKVSFPDSVPSDCTEVIKSLGRKKPEERVTMQKGGVATLQEMGFFSVVDWVKLQNKQLTAPFVPGPFNLERLKGKTLAREIDLQASDIVPWDGHLPGVSSA